MSKKVVFTQNDINDSLSSFSDKKGKKVKSLQDIILDYIKKHPNCRREHLYKLHNNDGHVREAITKMLKSGKIKETFTITK